MTEREHLDQTELEDHDGELLPERAAMSIVRTPGEAPVPPVDPDAPPDPDALLQPSDQ
jgi:hypothetical protein